MKNTFNSFNKGLKHILCGALVLFFMGDLSHAQFVVSNQEFQNNTNSTNSVHPIREEKLMVITLPDFNIPAPTPSGGGGGAPVHVPATPSIDPTPSTPTPTEPRETNNIIVDKNTTETTKPEKNIITFEPTKQDVINTEKEEPLLSAAPKPVVPKTTYVPPVKYIADTSIKLDYDSPYGIVEPNWTEYSIVAPKWQPILRRPEKVKPNVTVTVIKKPLIKIQKTVSYQIFTPFNIFILILLIILMVEIMHNRKETTSYKCKRGFLYGVILIAASLLLNGTYQAHAAGLTNTRDAYYSGYLQDAGLTPLSGDYTFRFSLWNELTFGAGTDVNAALPEHFGVTEARTTTVVAGNFEFELDFLNTETTALLKQEYVYVQVEIKPVGAPDSSYFLVDVNPTDATIDRLLFRYPPYTGNSETLDFHNTGTGIGDIPFVGADGYLPSEVIPNELNQTSFKIGNGNTTDDIALSFGDTTDADITWSPTNDNFTFNKDVVINGTLTVSGGITLGETTYKEVLSPMYANSVFQGDGLNNKGSMHEEALDRAGNLESMIRWQSESPTLQDYQLVVRYPLTDEFIRFDNGSPQISFDFETEGTIADAYLNFTVNKEGVPGDQITAAGQNLQNNTWNTQTFTLDAGTTWDTGDTMIFVIDFFAKDNNAVRIGDIGIEHVKQ